MAPVAFRIEIEQQNGFCVLCFRAGTHPPLFVESVSWSRFTASHDELREDLEEFREEIGERLHITDWDSLDRAIRMLDDRGSMLLFQLLGRQGTIDSAKFLEENASSAVLGVVDLLQPVPVVEIQSFVDVMNFEALPLLPHSLPRKIDNPSALQLAMSRFLGMRTVIRRPARRQQWQDRQLRNPEKLPMKVFCDESLPGSVQELDFFRTMFDYLEVDGPWPSNNEIVIPSEKFEEYLARLLTDPSKTSDSRARQVPDQIHHICCHCYTDETSANDYFLQFSCENGTHRASLGKLSANYYRLYRDEPRAQSPPPFAFLNACASAHIDAGALSSFPDLLLQSHRAVIGTETRMPDGVAAAFSIAFYKALLSGRTVGESLHAARWSILIDYNNPLGILYTLHGDPDLKLTHPLSGGLEYG